MAYKSSFLRTEHLHAIDLQLILTVRGELGQNVCHGIARICTRELPSTGLTLLMAPKELRTVLAIEWQPSYELLQRNIWGFSIINVRKLRKLRRYFKNKTSLFGVHTNKIYIVQSNYKYLISIKSLHIYIYRYPQIAPSNFLKRYYKNTKVLNKMQRN